MKYASPEAYFIHLCAVAKILIELGLDSATVAAAFLHDVIEDTPVTEADIRSNFGDEILGLVSGVTKLDKIVFKSREEEEAENFRKIFVAMAKDIRVIIIKLADRLHNMRSLNFLSIERQKKMAQETLDVYTPLAGRLGISQIKCELEDLCLKYLDPEAYEYLVENIHQKLYERHNFVDFVVKEIKKILDESKIEGEVFGRPKHFYSIYKKMKQQNKTLDQIYDLTAVICPYISAQFAQCDYSNFHFLTQQGFCCIFASKPAAPGTAAKTDVPIAMPILFPREINAYWNPSLRTPVFHSPYSTQSGIMA